MKRIMLIVGVFLITLTAAAGERLPDGMLAHASANSLSDALANIDALIVSSIKNTPAANQYQPGMLPMMAGMFSPFPASAWDMKAEIHAVAVMTSPMNPQPAFIVKTAGLSAFKKAMSDGGIKLAGDGKKMSAPVPKLNNTWYFADIGDNRIVGSISEAGRDFVVKVIADGWSPKHEEKADLAINLDMKNLMTHYKPAFDAAMSEAKRQMEAEGNKGDVPESAKPLIRVLSKSLVKTFEKAEEELPAWNNLGLALLFNGERMKLAFSLSGDKESGLEAMRAAYEDKDHQYALVDSLPEETVLADTFSDLTLLPEGLVNLYVESLREVAVEAIPDRADEIAALPRQFLDLGVTDYTAGSYYNGSQPVMAIYFGCAKPKELQALIPKALELGQEFMDSILNLSGQAAALSIATEYEADAGTIGTIPYHRIAIRFAREGEGDPAQYEVLFALGRKTVSAVYGQVNEGDLEYAIANYQAAKGAFFHSETVKKSLDEIDNGQIKFMAMRPLHALANFYIGQAVIAGANDDAVRATASKIHASQDCIALAAGTTDEYMTFECVLPAAVINDFIVNAEVITELQSALSAGDAENSEVYFDDPQGNNGAEKDNRKYFDDPDHNADTLRKNK